MAEYIERTLITTELPFVMKKYGNYFNERQIEKIVEIVYELENSIEAADVQSVKRGHWIEETPKHSRCSCCDVTCLIAVYPTSADANFCPNCGADMRGDTE